jgi:hypothetical protein
MLKWIILALAVLGCAMFFREPEKIDNFITLPYELKGNSTAQTLIVFLHGFPNSVRYWDHLVKELDKEYLCLSVSYPNFSKDFSLKWGLDNEHLGDLVKSTIEKIVLEPYPQVKKKIFISIGMIPHYIEMKHKGFIDHIISLDTGIGHDTFKAKVLGKVYRIYLGLAFLIGGPVGDFMALKFRELFIKDLNGNTEEDNRRFNSSWCYSYYYGIRDQLLGKAPTPHNSLHASIDYLFGTKKEWHFHSEEYLQAIRAKKNSSIHPVDEDHKTIAFGQKNLIIALINKHA